MKSRIERNAYMKEYLRKYRQVQRITGKYREIRDKENKKWREKYKAFTPEEKENYLSKQREYQRKYFKLYNILKNKDE
jgi:hypothetical protein